MTRWLATLVAISWLLLPACIGAPDDGGETEEAASGSLSSVKRDPCPILLGSEPCGRTTCYADAWCEEPNGSQCGCPDGTSLTACGAHSQAGYYCAPPSP